MMGRYNESLDSLVLLRGIKRNVTKWKMIENDYIRWYSISYDEIRERRLTKRNVTLRYIRVTFRGLFEQCL